MPVNPDTPGTSVTLTTAPRPGAVALLQLHGPDVERVLQQLTGIDQWTSDRVRLADFAGIDRGLATMSSSGDRPWAQLMPHGGPRVVQKLIEKLTELGVNLQVNPDPVAVYPEADSSIQADTLACVARATSPAAIDLLLAQPVLWRHAMENPQTLDTDSISARTGALDRLIDPPSVVVVGRPNVGKSTLMNQMLGRAVSIVADLPGTTRDWVGGLVELGDVKTGVSVRWLDTPGLRASSDEIEQRAIQIAAEMIASSDVLIAMRDPTCDWPEPGAMKRKPDIWVLNKADQLAGRSEIRGDGKGPDTPLEISAKSGEGVSTLQAGVLALLGLEDLDPHAIWAFSDTLKRFVSQGADGLADYLSVR
jgi:tRNA modification GTPase